MNQEPQQKPLNLELEIRRRNKLFSKATKAEKRVLVAKDVLQQLKNKRIEAGSGEFVDFVDMFRYVGSRGDSVRNLVLEKKPGTDTVCRCCAYGALALSCTLFNNNSNVDDVLIGRYTPRKIDTLRNGFSKLFDKAQLKLIEIAFEMGWGYYRVFGRHTSPKMREARVFCRGTDSDLTRMKKIMKNIIENNGTFIP